MRAVEDHHVDRPDVEVRQRMQLTGTNRSIGLIACPCFGAGSRRVQRQAPDPDPGATAQLGHAMAPSRPRKGRPPAPARRRRKDETHPIDKGPCLHDLVVIARGPHPIPFRTRPLSPSAPMVLRLKARESRSSPGLASKGCRSQGSGIGSQSSVSDT